MSDQRLFVELGGNRMHNFQPTMNNKTDLPSQLRSEQIKSPENSQPIQNRDPVPSNISSQPQSPLQSPGYSNPATPPVLPDHIYDSEDESESSDNDLPMMPDSTSEEEIENDHEVDFDEHNDNIQNDLSSQPLFRPGSHASEHPTRKSSRFVQKLYNETLQ